MTAHLQVRPVLVLEGGRTWPSDQQFRSAEEAYPELRSMVERAEARVTVARLDITGSISVGLAELKPAPRAAPRFGATIAEILESKGR